MRRSTRTTGLALLAALAAGGRARAADEPAWVDAETCLPEPTQVGAGFRAPWEEKKQTRQQWLESGDPFFPSPLTEAAQAVAAALAPGGPDPVEWRGIGAFVDFATGTFSLPGFPPPDGSGKPAAAPRVAAATARAELAELQKAVTDHVVALYVRSAPRSDVWVEDRDEVNVSVTVLAPEWTAARAADLDLDDAELDTLLGYATALWAATAEAVGADLATLRERQKGINQDITALTERLSRTTDERQRAGIAKDLADHRRRLKDVQDGMRSLAGGKFAAGRERVAAADLDAGSVLWARVAPSGSPPVLNVTARARVGRLFAVVRRASTGSFATDAQVAATKALLATLAKDRMRPAITPR